MDTIQKYAKAIVGTGVAFLGGLGTALADGVVTPLEWVGISSVTLVAAGAIFYVPNKGTSAPGKNDALVAGDGLGGPEHSA